MTIVFVKFCLMLPLIYARIEFGVGVSCYFALSYVSLSFGFSYFIDNYNMNFSCFKNNYSWTYYEWWLSFRRYGNVDSANPFIDLIKNVYLYTVPKKYKTKFVYSTGLIIVYIEYCFLNKQLIRRVTWEISQ